MTLVDAGPLVALIDQGEQQHARCVVTLASLTLPMVTSWAAFTEAMYLLGRGGWTAQRLLWRLVLQGALMVDSIEAALVPRVHALMEQYRDLPMDLADASLIVLAEERGLTRIFTLDAHFHAYRIHGRRRLEVIP